jgi:membrane protease subunit HflK
MLTKDENIVDVRLAVQYLIKDAKNYAFNVRNQAATLNQVAEATLSGVIGRSTMDFEYTQGRAEIVADIKGEIQQVMDSYTSGIFISSVNMQDAQPPEQVQGAFEDAIKAREDQQRLINEAQAYSNGVIPVARGNASRLTQEAEGYKARVVSRAEGEGKRFTDLLTEYLKAPEITRKRLYIETMETVLSETKTVMIDVQGSNNLLYLPLDKLTQQTTGKQSANTFQSRNVNTQSTRRATQPAVRTSNRGRDARGR